MDGLEESGIPGQTYLKEALRNCDDPMKAIEEFQVENGILLPSLRTILPLLDLHSVPRLHFHTSVLEELREILLTQIDKIAKEANDEAFKKIKDLLEKSFPLIRVKSIQPIVMAILKNLEKIEDKYIKDIVADKNIYSKCHLSVKRQIWQGYHYLFCEELTPLFSKYIQEKQNHLHSLDKSSPLQQTPRQRRQNEVIQSLVEMIGKNFSLYDTCLQYIRTLFLSTKNSFYCSLRVDLLMALHDAEIQDITSSDLCHKFIWCLDACIREQNIDVKRFRELQVSLESLNQPSEPNQDQIIIDLSITLSDPYAINFLATRAIKILNNLTSTEGLPRDNPILALILRMLNLGLHSHDIFKSANTKETKPPETKKKKVRGKAKEKEEVKVEDERKPVKEPELDPEIITKFLPVLMSLMVDDQVRSVNSKLPPDDRQSALTIIEHSGPPPDVYAASIQKSKLASVLAFFYTFQVLKQKDRTGILRVLGCLSNAKEDILSDDRLLHTLVFLLIGLCDEFSSEEFCSVVFDEIFLCNMQHGNIPFFLIVLIHEVYKYLPQPRLELIMKTLTSYAIEDDESKQLMVSLQAKIDKHLESITYSSIKLKLESTKSDDFWNYSKPTSFNFDLEQDFIESTVSLQPTPLEEATGILSKPNNSLKLVTSEEADHRVAEYSKFFSVKQSTASSTFPRVATLIKRLIAGENADIHAIKSLDGKAALLDAAIEHHDGDTIVTIIVFLEKTLSWSLFVSEIMSRPVAVDHYIEYLNQTNRLRDLSDFLSMLRRNEDAAMVNYANALKCTHMETKIKNLKHCYTNFFKDLQDDIYCSSIVEQINLYEKQLPIDAADAKDQNLADKKITLPFNFVGSSLISTLFYCILYHYQLSENNFASPKAIQKAHGASDKQFYWTAVRALAKAKRWSDVENLFQYQTFFGSKKVKQVIPFDQVVRVLQKEAAPFDVLIGFLRQITDEELKLKLSQELNIK